MVDENKATPEVPAAEMVYFHSLDSKGRLITVQGVLVEQTEHSLTVQHSSGDQHTYFSAYDLNNLKVGNHFRAFAYRRPGMDEYERLFQLPETCHPDGNPETPFDADRHAVEIFDDWQAADVAAAARATAADLFSEEERLKAEVVGLLQSLQAAGKVATDYVQDVGRLLGMLPAIPVVPPASAPVPGTTSVGVARRTPVTFSRRALPARAEIIASVPVTQEPASIPAGIPTDRVISTKAGKKGKEKRPKVELLSRADKKKLKKKTGWLNP